MAAGLGFKTFTTGEVLTAADVNGYLMQGVLVFASAAARDAAITSPQEGQFAYTKDNNSLWYYTGSAWAASGATGDIEGVTAGTGLTGGGTSGTVTLDFDVANYGGGQWAAGKNKFINGDFSVNQRNFSSTTTDGDYTFDRWKCALASGTVTFSAQTFTPGTAPVAGYEGKNYLRSLVSGQTTQGQFAFIAQRIEDVRTFAGQTVTISFWAKAASGTPKIGITRQQNFGSGGSPSATVETSAGLISAITTSWARYSVSFAVPSISGKTIGTTANSSYLSIWLVTSAGTDYTSLMGAVGLQNNTIDIWGVQIEAGSTATPFQTATGTIQGELAACQRYYWRNTAPTATAIGYAIGRTSTQADIVLTFPVTMRTNPTAVETGGTFDFTNPNVGAWNITSFTFVHCSYQTGFIKGNTASGLSQGVIYELGIPTNGYVGFSAEL